MTIALPHFERRYDPHYPRNRKAVMDAVALACGDAYGVTFKQILSPSQCTEIAAARGIAAFLLREFGFSLGEIGDYFGRHHSTIFMAHRRVNARIARDDRFHGTVSLIAGQAGLA